MASLRLHIDNMHCGACIRRVTQALNALPDTQADEVHLGGAHITTNAPPQAVQQALSAAGYPASIESSTE